MILYSQMPTYQLNTMFLLFLSYLDLLFLPQYLPLLNLLFTQYHLPLLQPFSLLLHHRHFMGHLFYLLTLYQLKADLPLVQATPQFYPHNYLSSSSFSLTRLHA